MEAVNIFLNHDLVFKGIGLVNARFGVVESVFLVYPANDHYALAYSYRPRMERIRWRPWPAGLLFQDGRLTIMLGVSSHDQHFRDPDHAGDLHEMVQRVEHVRRLVGARQKTFAGILPGVLAHEGIVADPPEGDITATVVVQAIKTLTSGFAEAPAIIVLGGCGFVGSRIVDQLRDTHEPDLHVVDAADPATQWPAHLHGQPALVVNVATRHALPDLLDRLWPGMVILNEVYPEPTPDLIAALTDMNVAVHHVVGVEAKAYPPFPAAYAGAIPCCAAWPSPTATVVTRHLNPTTGGD